jgi:predicted amidophosphoribosyltransferase
MDPLFLLFAFVLILIIIALTIIEASRAIRAKHKPALTRNVSKSLAPSISSPLQVVSTPEYASQSHPVSPQQSELPSCPACSKPLRPGDRFCSQCGYRLLAECPTCSKPLRPGDRFCSQCGYRLTRDTPSIPSSVLKPTANDTCPYCYAPRQSQDQFCGTCGKPTISSIDETQPHWQ